MPAANALRLRPTTKTTLKDGVTESLRAAIFDRTLSPGQRLPEALIASSLGVSRAPVRDALAVLVQEGLVHRNDRGAVVTQLSRADVDEISSLRLSLEALAIRLAIRHATDRQWEQLAENIRRTAQAKAQVEAGELDLGFHELLVRAANHRRLLECWLSLRSQIRLLLLQMGRTDAEFARHAAAAHQELIEAIRARDEEQAVALLRQQLENTHQRVAESYDKTLQPSKD